MRHPNEKINQEQIELLASLSEMDREWHERIFRVGNAVYCYHLQAGGKNHDPTSVKPTEEDFKDWLDGLSEIVRKDMESKGFEACKAILPFTRHVLERRDIGLEEWMKKHLSEPDFEWWKSEE